MAAGRFAVAHWTGDRRYAVICCQKCVARQGKTGSCGVPTRSDVRFRHRVQGRRQGDRQGACPTLLTWTSVRRKCPDLMLAGGRSLSALPNKLHTSCKQPRTSLRPSVPFPSYAGAGHSSADIEKIHDCLLYTSDAADEEDSVD